MEKQAGQSVTGNIKEHLNFISLIKGIIVAYAVTIPTFMVFAFILSYTDFPEKYITVIVIITTILSILVAGSTATRGVKSKGWLNGSLVGLVYIIVLYILSSIVFRDFSIDRNVISMTAIGVLTGAIGGIIGINLKTSGHGKRKSIKRIKK